MLSPDDRDEIARRFGADDSQIERDHLISHLLAQLGPLVGGDVVFFGGTALSRTHLTDGRLSEDIDLYTVGKRDELAALLTERWPRAVRAEYPGVRWQPALTEVRDVEPATMSTRDGTPVRVQLLAADATYARWPTQLRGIDVRYRDVPAVELRVPTRSALVAMRAAAWRDRHAARDLYDLAGLARGGAVTAEAVTLLRKVTGAPLVSAELDHLRGDLNWHQQLAHQTRLVIDAETALRQVRDAWEQASAEYDVGH
jgi:predicted nucleotidyltransferase component of viral defense system